MSKISIIIQREYTTRVMKKSFIILTFLTPVLFALIFFVPTLMNKLGDSSQKNIVVIDQTGLYSDVLKNNDTYKFDFVDKAPDEVKEDAKTNSDITGLLIITENLVDNPKGATLYSEKQINVETKSYISGLLSKYVEEQKLASYNIPNLREMVESSQTHIDIPTIKWSSDGQDKEGSAELALIIGVVAAMIIYMFIIIYGSQVMSGVLQEKTSRIVEVMISSVKPFELMMGKIVGIALVGLTQVLMWVMLTVVIIGVASPFLLSDPTAAMQISGQEISAENLTMIQEILTMLKGFNLVQIGILFIVYFLGGYLLYASLFAAVGSAVDNETDSNQFTLPITLPIIFALFAGIYASRHPDAALSFWTSMIPFTSPVVMMARLPFGVPIWQIILSIGILILSFIGTTWIAGKIYRTGILMYGKKPSWAEIFKWLKY